MYPSPEASLMRESVQWNICGGEDGGVSQGKDVSPIPVQGRQDRDVSPSPEASLMRKSVQWNVCVGEEGVKEGTRATDTPGETPEKQSIYVSKM